MCAQRRHKSACSFAQSDQSLRCPHEETLHTWLSQMRPVKILISLRESEFSLGAHVLRYLFGCFSAYICTWLVFFYSLISSLKVSWYTFPRKITFASLLILRPILDEHTCLKVPFRIFQCIYLHLISFLFFDWFLKGELINISKKDRFCLPFDFAPLWEQIHKFRWNSLWDVIPLFGEADPILLAWSPLEKEEAETKRIFGEISPFSARVIFLWKRRVNISSLFKMRQVEVLIRLREYADWSQSSLGAHIRICIFWR